MLTPRQIEVAQLVAQGKSNKAVARETGLAIDTVNWHLRNIAERVPGDGSPRYKAMVVILHIYDKAS